MLLYPISSKSPQSDLDNKATLPGVRDPESDPNDETQSDTTETAFSGYTITLDAGHGGYDPGKIGINDSKEKDINLQIASYLQELLDSLGFEVYMTRTDDSSLNTETAESLKTSDLNHRIEIVAVRHGARHGTQQLLRGGRRQHRGHQRVRVRVRVPGGARHHPCRGYRVPHPHALKGA